MFNIELTGNQRELNQVYWSGIVAGDKGYTLWFKGDLPEFVYRNFEPDPIGTYTFQFEVEQLDDIDEFENDSHVIMYTLDEWKQKFPRWGAKFELALLESLL